MFESPAIIFSSSQDKYLGANNKVDPTAQCSVAQATQHQPIIWPANKNAILFGFQVQGEVASRLTCLLL